MKAKVLIGFKDKYTGERYFPGEHISVTQERINEILEKGALVKSIENPESALEPGEEKKEEPENEKRSGRKEK